MQLHFTSSKNPREQRNDWHIWIRCTVRDLRKFQAVDAWMIKKNETNETTLIHTKTISEDANGCTWPNFRWTNPDNSICSDPLPLAVPGVSTRRRQHITELSTSQMTQRTKLLPNNSYLHLIWMMMLYWLYRHTIIYTWEEEKCDLAAPSPVLNLLELNFLGFHFHSERNVPSKLIPTSRSDARLLCKTIKGCQGNCSSPYDRQTPHPHPTPFWKKGIYFAGICQRKTF